MIAPLRSAPLGDENFVSKGYKCAFYVYYTMNLMFLLAFNHRKPWKNRVFSAKKEPP
jgi:hypothetical protein